MREHDRSCSTGDAIHRVMFRHPEPAIAIFLCSSGKLCSVGQRFADRAAFAHGYKVEYG